MKKFFVHFTAFLIAAVLTVVLVNWIILPRFVKLGEEIEVPDLRGIGLEDARMRCAVRGLEMVVQAEVYDPVVRANHVHSQNPPPGRPVKRGRKIRVTYSLGVEEFPFPDLHGLSARQAMISLERIGLRAGKILKIHSDMFAKDQVIGCDPAEGTAVLKGHPVTLLVSDGPFPVLYVMPDLVGKSVDLIKQRLSSYELKLDRIRAMRDSRYPSGTITEQKPRRGSAVRKGDLVEVIVAMNE